jgi:hypothetical protein
MTKRRHISEELPTNNASTPGISGLNSDGPIIRKRKARDIAKAIILRKNRRKLQSEEYLQESGGKVIDQLKKVAKSGQSGPIVFDDGSKIQTSPQDAAKLVDLYRNLNSSNKVKMIRSINDSSSNYEKIRAFAQSKT